MGEPYETDAALDVIPHGAEITEALRLLDADRKLPEDCVCFPGCCRGGDVVAGRLANGQWCKETAAVMLTDGFNDNDGSEPD